MTFQIISVMLGSPPLTRERLGSAAGAIVGGRITPADAGKTFAMLRAVEIKWDHPR